MGTRTPRAGPDQADELLADLLASLLAADQIAAHGVLERALQAGWSADDVRFALITPALHEIGMRWERGAIGVGDEHLATSVCEWLLLTLAGRTRRTPPSGRRAVVGCSEGELHALGARMVANVLTEAGWTVLFLGASTPASAWSPIVRSRHADAAVVATTMPDGVATVRPTLESIRAARPECLLAIGGQAYAGRGGAARRVGADLFAEDPRELIRAAEALRP
jgi:methanogenic corrinoid protein MtbC1